MCVQVLPRFWRGHQVGLVATAKLATRQSDLELLVWQIFLQGFWLVGGWLVEFERRAARIFQIDGLAQLFGSWQRRANASQRSVSGSRRPISPPQE